MKKAKLSRQRRYQLKRKEEGKCETCGRIAFKAGECRLHYVMRALRRLDPDHAEALTKRVLMGWAVAETQGLQYDESFELNPATIRWIDKWWDRIGGKES